MINGITNIGVWQCVDMGVWQSGCFAVVLGCGKLQSRPVLTGRFQAKVKLEGKIQSRVVSEGIFGTYSCED